MTSRPGRSAAMLSPYGERQERLRLAMQDAELGALLLFGLKNIRYLTGFSGSSGVLLVTPEETVLVSDSRYRLRAAEEAGSARFFEVNDQLKDHLPTLLQASSGTIGIEDNHLTLQRWRNLEPGLQGRGHCFVDGLVERLRLVKTSGELQLIRQSCALISHVMASLTSMGVGGRPEREIALELEMLARRQGSEPVPFDFIVAAGPRGAMPHAEASPSVIAKGTLLVVDIGTSVQGYASDMTRTFAVGEVSRQAREIYEIVRAAQQKGREAARVGVACREVDAAAREVIAAAGYGDYFQHSLGHGVGLEVHEGPRLSASSDETLAAGMVVTIEPGVYLPGVGGVRIEDTVLVTEDGIEDLTSLSRELTVID